MTKSTSFLCFLVAWLGLASLSQAGEIPRYFLMGDGVLAVQQQSIRFRNPDGTYRPAGLKKINQLFRAPWTPKQDRVSLRFVEILDYVQDQLQGGTYRIRSGYRSPRQNTTLRKKGKMAAQSSMHIEGAAGDLILSGVPSGDVFEYVKSLNCCGIGWYHSQHFHLDAGPPRYWDETTAKTKSKERQENEKIILQADYDRYLPGETISVKFMRISQYPIGVPEKFELVRLDETKKSKPQPLAMTFPPEIQTTCAILRNRRQARHLSATLPNKGLAPGKYALKVSFCNRFDYEKMPEEILSRPFEILGKK